MKNIGDFIFNNFTIVPNEYIKGTTRLPSDELLILSVLLMIKNNKDIAMFNIKWLCTLYNSTTSNTTISKTISNNLKCLSNKGIVKYYSDITLSKEIDITNCSKSDMIFASIIVTPDKQFTMIKDRYILEILQSPKKIKKVNRSKLYSMCAYILSCVNLQEINTDYKLCNISQSRITKEIGVSSHSISKYNIILKELNILDYMNLTLKNPIGGIKKKLPTYYCNYEDKELLDKKKEYFIDTGYYEEISELDKTHSSNKTSVKLKIYNLEEKIKNNTITTEELAILRNLKAEYEGFSSC